MLRFLSRKNRRDGPKNAKDTQKKDLHRILTNKNCVQCRVLMLDGTDLSIDLSVSDRTTALLLLKPVFFELRARFISKSISLLSCHCLSRKRRSVAIYTNRCFIRWISSKKIISACSSPTPTMYR